MKLQIMLNFAYKKSVSIVLRIDSFYCNQDVTMKMIQQLKSLAIQRACGGFKQKKSAAPSFKHRKLTFRAVRATRALLIWDAHGRR